MNNFDFLKVDECYAKQISHNHSTLFRKIGPNKYMRYIIANQKYEQHEIDKLNHLKRVLQEKRIPLTQSLNFDTELMRFINGDCQTQTAIEYIEKAIQYQKQAKMDFSIIQKKILEKGVVYLGGRDKWLRPTIIVQANLINKNEVEEFKQGMIYMFQFAIDYLFIDEYIENWNVIVETNNMSVLSINFSVLGEIIQSMKYLFPSRLHNIFITNPSTSLSLSWSIISEFIDKYQLEQVQLISKSEFIKIKRFYHPEQLEKKYGGALKNFNSFWPPTNTLNQEYLARYYTNGCPQPPKDSLSQISPDSPKFANAYFNQKHYSRSLTPDQSSPSKQKQAIFGDYKPGQSRQSTLVMTSAQGRSMMDDYYYNNKSVLPNYNSQRNQKYWNYEFQFEKDQQYQQQQQPREQFLQSYSQLVYQKKQRNEQSKDRGCFCGFCYQKKKNQEEIGNEEQAIKEQEFNIIKQQQQQQQKDSKISLCFIF